MKKPQGLAALLLFDSAAEPTGALDRLSELDKAAATRLQEVCKVSTASLHCMDHILSFFCFTSNGRFADRAQAAEDVAPLLEDSDEKSVLLCGRDLLPLFSSVLKSTEQLVQHLPYPEWYHIIFRS